MKLLALNKDNVINCYILLTSSANSLGAKGLKNGAIARHEVNKVCYQQLVDIP